MRAGVRVKLKLMSSIRGEGGGWPGSGAGVIGRIRSMRAS